MKTVYRYSKERHFPQPPEAIWPFVADTARLNEISGSPRYRVEERPDAQGRIHRFATVAVGPLRIKWEEGYGEWQENRRLSQTRNFVNGPVPPFPFEFRTHAEGTGTRLAFSAEVECVGVLGWLARRPARSAAKATSGSPQSRNWLPRLRSSTLSPAPSTKTL